ncbi:MAG: hypothetical protein AB7D02_02375 [Candidatus Paceibacterota bacterium]
MKIQIKNKIKNSPSLNQTLSKLEQELATLLSNHPPLDVVIPIEIRNSPSLFSRIRRFLKTFSFKSFKPADGATLRFPHRKIVLYKKALKGDFTRLMHIVLHEIGHFLDFDYKNQSQREKRADEFAEKFGYGHSSLRK